MAETTKQPQHRPRVGAAGFGTGPVVAAGAMFAGGVIAAGVGLGNLAFGASEAQEKAGGGVSVESPDNSGKEDQGGRDSGSGAAPEDGEVTVTLPDEDGNGVADALEEDSPQTGSDSGSEDKSSGPGTVPAEPKPETKVYIIERGDTLTEISADTGVSLGRLVETNNIANPNLIYAGAALLIPPTI